MVTELKIFRLKWLRSFWAKLGGGSTVLSNGDLVTVHKAGCYGSHSWLPRPVAIGYGCYGRRGGARNGWWPRTATYYTTMVNSIEYRHMIYQFDQKNELSTNNKVLIVSIATKIFLL